MKRDMTLMALIYEHFGKVSPEEAMRATRFAEAVAAMEREQCAKTADSMDCAHRCRVGQEVGAAIRQDMEAKLRRWNARVDAGEHPDFNAGTGVAPQPCKHCGAAPFTGHALECPIFAWKW